jgi:hypothetical protein
VELDSKTRDVCNATPPHHDADSLPGMDIFARAFNPHRKLLIGGHGIPIDEFLSLSVETRVTE